MIMVFGSHLDIRAVSLDRVLLYIISVMDSIVEKQYSVRIIQLKSLSLLTNEFRIGNICSQWCERRKSTKCCVAKAIV